jgi:hypothetical protein
VKTPFTPATLEGWRERAEVMERELIQLRDRENRRIRHEREEREAMESAVRRAVLDDVHRILSTYLWADVERPVRFLIREVREAATVLDKTGRRDAHVTAARLRLTVNELEAGMERAATAAGRGEDLPLFRALRRMRDVVVEAAEALRGGGDHKVQPGPTGNCECPGCGLIREAYAAAEGVDLDG